MSIPFSRHEARVFPFPVRAVPDADIASAFVSRISSHLNREHAQIIPFPVRGRFPSRLTPQERVEVSEWEDRVRASGFVQVTICAEDCSSDASAGEFVLIYSRGDLWVLEIIAGTGRRFAVRRHSSQSKASDFATITEALNATLEAAAA